MKHSWVAIQRNPRSGSGRRRRVLLDLIAALQQRGVHVRSYRNRERLAAHLADSDRRANLIGIVAAGGDGTVADVVNRYPELPVCPFPLGTENVLCRKLGIPPDGAQVAEILCRGRTQQFDVGLAGQRRFLLMASCGFDAEVIHRLHHNRRGNISHASYFWPILSTACGFDWPEYRVFLDDSPEPLRGSMIVVANFNAYAFRLGISPHAVPDDGLLSVTIFERPGLAALFRYLQAVRRGTHQQLPDVRCATAQRMRLEASRESVLQIDGDPAGSLPADLTIIPRGMQLFVP